MITRQRQLPELIAQRTPAEARNDLDVYSRAETLAAIPPVDFAPVEADIAEISGSLYTLDMEVAAISGILTTDIQNLDLSLTQKIVEDCVQSEGISGSSTTVNGYLNVTINGVSYRLATVA